MRQIALLGLALCLVSLLLSAQAADGSVGGIFDRGLRFITQINEPPAAAQPAPPHASLRSE